MKVILLLIFSLFFFGEKETKPIKLKWKQLEIEEFKEVWYEEHLAYINDAIFTSEQKELNDKRVEVEGIVTLVPLDSAKSIFFLSEKEIDFYHLHANPGRVIVLNEILISNGEINASKNNDLVIGGIFKVNIENDVNELYYSMDSVYIVK